MILNNYWNYYKNSQEQGFYQSYGAYYLRDDFDCLSMVDGEPLRVCIGGYGLGSDTERDNSVKQFLPLANLDAVVGTGSTAATKSDYQLVNDVTASLYNVSTAIDVTVDQDGIHVIVTISGTNTTGSSMTISEIGIYKKVFSQIYEVSTPTEKVLFIRHLLTSPKSVGNNETFSLTLEWVES